MTWDSNDLISVLKNEFHLVETHTIIWSIFFARGKYAGYSALTILTVIFYFIYLNCDLNLGDGQTAPSSLLPPTPLFLQPPPPLMYFFTCFIKQRQRRAMDTWSQQEHDLHLKGYSGHILVILEEEIYLSGRFFRAIIFCSRINFSLGN